MTTFHLQGKPFINLNNLLKVEGLCESGAAAKQVISMGLVTVNDQVELRKRCKITHGQIVGYDGHSIQVE